MRKKNKYKGQKQRPNQIDRINNKFEGKSISRDDDARSVKSGENDAAWYGVSGQMVKDTASVSFNNPVGYPLDLGTSDYFDDPSTGPDLVMPGIMALYTCMGPGVSRNNNSAVNLAAKNIYTFVRHVNAGAANYEPADLMLYLLGVGSAYTWYTHLVRAYGIARTYKQTNRYYPDVLLIAMGINPRSIKNNLPRFRSIINTFVRKIGSRPIPANLNFLKRQTWMYSNIFKDAESNKAQLYMFVPKGFHLYDEYSGAGRLKWVQWDWLAHEGGSSTDAQPVLDLDDIEAFSDRMSELILESEDLGIISGDIVKAYGQNLFTLTEINEDFYIEPIHSMEVLTQIHNTFMVGDPNLNSMHVNQSTGTEVGSGALLWSPQSYQYKVDVASDTPHSPIGRNIALTELNHVLDLPYDNPTPDDVMVATRLNARLTERPYGALNPDSSARYLSIDCATEFISNMRIWTATKSGDSYTYYNVNGSIITGGSPTANMASSTLDLISKFDWHPILYFYRGSNDVTKWSEILTFGDFDNVTTIDSALMKRMDNAAVLSLWDVPETAFYKG